MERADFSTFACSIARTLAVVGESWTLLVMRDLLLGFERFDEIQRDLGIASNVLSVRLNTLLQHGLVDRTRDPKDGRILRYRLTRKGLDLHPVLLGFMAWGDKWANDGAGPPMRLRHRGCDHTTAAVLACSVCLQPLALEDIVFEAGAGGRTQPGTALVASRLEPAQRNRAPRGNE